MLFVFLPALDVKVNLASFGTDDSVIAFEVQIFLADFFLPIQEAFLVVFVKELSEIRGKKIAISIIKKIGNALACSRLIRTCNVRKYIWQWIWDSSSFSTSFECS